MTADEVIAHRAKLERVGAVGCNVTACKCGRIIRRTPNNKMFSDNLFEQDRCDVCDPELSPHWVAVDSVSTPDGWNVPDNPPIRVMDGVTGELVGV
jgi:hypothetical protein